VSRRALFRLGLSGGDQTVVDYDSVTDRVRAGWEAAPSEPLLRALEPVGPVLAGLVGVMAGERVLDVGAGDGNVALACLERGAVVEACDIAEAMVERGRARTGPSVEWRHADVQALPYDDGSFDVVLSAFGAALAPRARRAARELVRVLRPGGRLAFAAWTPEGLPGALDAHVPLPDGVLPPSAWADDQTARRRFEPHLEWLERRTRRVALRFAGREAMFDAFTHPLGLAEEERAALRPVFDRLAGDPAETASGAEFQARYVLYAGRRPD
jgi:SAM-dependent methyltransferase